jgi:hypothetical protein
MRLQRPLYTSNRHHERGERLLEAMLLLADHPGLAAGEIADTLWPSVKRKRYQGWWAASYLRVWIECGFLMVDYDEENKSQLRYFLTNKGYEALNMFGRERLKEQAQAK